MVEARVADDSGARKAVWFNQPWMADRLTAESHWYMEGRLEKGGFVVSACEPADGPAAEEGSGQGIRWQSRQADPPGLAGDSPRAAHSAGGEIGPATVAALGLRGLSDGFCHCRNRCLRDLLKRRGLPGLPASFREAHFPYGEERAALALRRLAYQELLEGQAIIRERRLRHRRGAGPALALESRELARKWLDGLPFELTGDQARAVSENSAELSGTEPMGRLLMGEVGSGKTVVAIHAMLEAVGKRCPGGNDGSDRSPGRPALRDPDRTAGRDRGGGRPAHRIDAGEGRERACFGPWREGRIGILVGTHALLEEPVRFSRLGLAVVDEEHRFGVRQRAGLDAKAPAGHAAHLLHMSATPIPRTLALTTYGDLDMSTLRELPAGRAPVTTEVVSEAGRGDAFARIRSELDQGRQAFVVCPAGR